MPANSTYSQFPIQPAYTSIEKIKAYTTGKPIDELSRELGLTDIIKLASNENPLGCSEAVKVAIADVMNDPQAGLARYPDGAGYHLKQAVAAKTGYDINHITLGNGSNDLLELLARTFVAAGDEIIFSEYAFVVYKLLSLATGATPIEVKAKNFGNDLTAMVAAITAKTKLIFIANPNNPTGTVLTASDVNDFLANVPAHVLVVLDEAYVEYFPETTHIKLLAHYPNLVIVRTFSKAYGLAALRVGFMLSHTRIADYVNRIRQPFNVNSLAQVAAIAALQDDDFVAQSRHLNQQQMTWLMKQLDSLGLAFVPSKANFIMVNVFDGNDVYDKLLKQGVIVRPLAGYNLPEWVRITIGLPEENARLIDTLAQVLA